MSSRSTRNTLLAVASAVGVVAAVLQVVAESLSLADILSFPTLAWWLKAAYAISVLAWVFALAAFGTALAGFLLKSRQTRITVLAVAAGLFMGYGISAFATALIYLIYSARFSPPWQFLASQSAGVAAGASLAVAAMLVLIGVRSTRPEGILGWASVGLAGHFTMRAAAYSFELAVILERFTPPARFSYGYGTTAAGNVVAAAAAVVATVAFFSSSGRRKRAEPWQARREGVLGVAAFVFALGFLMVAVGQMLLAAQTEPGRSAVEGWLQGGAQLLLSAAAVCGAAGFFLSRRDAERRASAATAPAPAA